MLKNIVSGGQTGADQAGLRAAKAAGIETGGWAPHGWTTEKGPAPWLADYGLAECPIPGYPARTDRRDVAGHAEPDVRPARPDRRDFAMMNRSRRTPRQPPRGATGAPPSPSRRPAR